MQRETGATAKARFDRICAMEDNALTSLDIPALLAAIDELTAEKAELIDELEAKLPATFFAGLPLEKRVQKMVEMWGRAIKANNELEARNAKLEAVAEVDVRDMANFCIAQGASKPWQEIAHRLLAALDALDD
jgi:hypothetical protein